MFTVYIYTAGKKKYADAVLKVVDPKNVIENRFYRDSCKKVEGTLIKDLKYLKKMLKTKQCSYLRFDIIGVVGSSSPSSVNQSLVHIEHKNDFILCCFDLGLCWNG